MRNDRIEELLNSVFDSPLLLGSVFIDKEANLWVTQWRGEIFFFPNTWKLTTSILVGQQTEIDKNLNLNYSISAISAQSLIPKEKKSYSINVIYSFTAL